MSRMLAAVGSGKHPQAPVAVAAKPHYFCELALERTVDNLLRDCPPFWTSQQLLEAAAGGEFLSLDPEYFARELSQILRQGTSSQRRSLEALLERFLEDAPLQLLCQRLLHLLGDADLAAFIADLWQPIAGAHCSTAAYPDRHPQQPHNNHWQSETSQGGARQTPKNADAAGTSGSGEKPQGAAAGRSPEQHSLFGTVRWRGLEEVLLASALVLNGPQLWRLLREDLGDEFEVPPPPYAKVILPVHDLANR